MDFELSEVRMNVGNVERPGGYLDAIISKVKSGKMNFDIFAYTDYPRNIGVSDCGVVACVAWCFAGDYACDLTSDVACVVCRLLCPRRCRPAH